MTDNHEQLAEQLRVALRRDATPSDEQVLAFRQRVEATLAAKADDTTDSPLLTSGRWRRTNPVAAGLVGVAAALLIVVAATVALNRPPGTVEYDGAMLAPGGGAEASIVVRAVETGRIIEFRTDDLPILPTSEFYELWFVSADDGSGSPDRISAGTFHPDAAGRSNITLMAAVNPELYPRLEVTAEPGDGNPLPTGPVVLEATIS